MKLRLLVSLLFLLFSCSNKNNVVKPLLDYIPENSFLIIKIENHKAFCEAIENNEFLEELSASKTHQNIKDKVQYIKYLSPKSEGILALTETLDNQFEFIYVTKNSSNLINLDSLRNKSMENIESRSSTFKKYTLENSSFYSLETNQKVIVSSSKSLLENLNEKVMANDSEVLQKLYNTADKNKPASIFLNLNNSTRLLSTIAKENRELNISGFSDWIALDIDDTRSNLNLSGVSIANDPTWNYIDILANTRPTKNTIASFAPAQTDAILSYTFNDYETFAKNRELTSGIVSPVEPPMSAVEEIGLIYIKNEKAVLVNTYGAEGISEFLSSQKKEVFEYQGQEILALNKGDFLKNRFSPIIKDYKANFCTLLKNAFIFSEKLDVLKTIIRDYKKVSTFEKTALYKTLNKEIAQESSILFISNSKKVESLIEENFSNQFSNDIKKGQLSKYGFAAQVITDKNFYHTNLAIQKIGSQVNTLSKNASNLFKVTFDNDLATNPQFVTNHQTGRKEIIVQDENNVLYLISDKGKVLWKKQLNSLIQGKVKQVDIFKNGRLQFVFTTNNQLMLLDRNGNEVKKFTKTYEGGNLNPIAVFDYDKKKNYRFVITQGVKTFMYDREAKIVKGFKFTSAEHPIIAAPKHIVISNKDFLVFKLKDGSLKLLNRVGDVRVKVDEKINFSDNAVFKYKNKFTLTDQKGMLYQIDLAGKITKTNFNLSNDHGMTTTDNSLVFMNDNVLTIKGKQVELELGVYTEPEIFYLNNKIYVSVTDLQNEKVYLFDSQAKPINNFPVNGVSRIDIGDINKNKNLELVTKDGNNSLSVYKIN